MVKLVQEIVQIDHRSHSFVAPISMFKYLLHNHFVRNKRDEEERVIIELDGARDVEVVVVEKINMLEKHLRGIYGNMAKRHGTQLAHVG